MQMPGLTSLPFLEPPLTVAQPTPRRPRKPLTACMCLTKFSCLGAQDKCVVRTAYSVYTCSGENNNTIQTKKARTSVEIAGYY